MERDIGDREVLLDLATKTGLSREEIEEAWLDPVWSQRLLEIADQAREAGATGVPTFIINDQYRIVGAQPIDVFKQVLDRIV